MIRKETLHELTKKSRRHFTWALRPNRRESRRLVLFNNFAADSIIITVVVIVVDVAVFSC